MGGVRDEPVHVSRYRLSALRQAKVIRVDWICFEKNFQLSDDSNKEGDKEKITPHVNNPQPFESYLKNSLELFSDFFMGKKIFILRSARWSSAAWIFRKSFLDLGEAKVIGWRLFFCL